MLIVVEPALAVERALPFSSIPPTAPSMVAKLADLAPRTLAIMHGSSFAGDARPAFDALAKFYEGKLREAVAK